MSDVSPDRIGPYQIQRRLGAGGMGTVYQAVHHETGAEVALKVLPPSLAREPGFVARFEREIEALQKLVSPHIVQFYESGVDGETWYYAMEFVDGETLTERLERDRRLPWREVIDLGVQICRALKAAHNAGVIHRDLKPSNLMLAGDGTIKLADFGVAQIFAGGKLTRTGGVIGTAEYMSPEQAQGKRATRQSDIYALGAVLYVMLTGRPPFTGKSALDIAQKHQYGQFDSPKRIVPEIPQWLDDVVCQCLAKRPEDRYPDAYVLSLRLQEIPRKVDFAAGASSSGEGIAGTAETLASNTAAAQGDAPIGGTFVRDVLRTQLDRTTAQTPLQRMFDNTWVLVSLLVLLIAVTVWFFRSSGTDPDRLFKQGQEAMKSENRSDWIRAGNENFRPLLDRDRKTWEPQIAPFLPNIALARAEQELLRLARRKPEEPAGEAEPLRQLHRISRDLQQGDFDLARMRLEALRDLLTTTDHPVERAVVESVLEQLPPVQALSDPSLIDDTLKRADQLHTEGQPAAARSLLNSVILLYRDDPAARQAVEAAERRLREWPETP